MRSILNIAFLALTAIAAKANDFQVVDLQEGQHLKDYLNDEKVPDSLIVTGGLSDQDFYDLRDYCVEHHELTALNLLGVSANEDNLPLSSFLKGTISEAESTGLRHVILPKSLKTIGNWAFGLQGNLQTVELPETLVSIGIAAFRLCDHMTDLLLPESLQRICHMAYAGCSSLHDVVLPDNLMIIDPEAFRSCDLSEVVVPESVHKIGYGAFAENRHLYKAVLPKDMRSIPSQLFYMSPITEITWSENLEEIWDDAFIGSGFEKLIFPLGLKRIGDGAFCESFQLQEVVLPESVERLEEAVFRDCPKLQRVICKSVVPPVVSADEDWLRQITLYVPQGSLGAYQSAAGWQACKEIKEMDVTGIHVMEFGVEKNMPVFDLLGRHLRGVPTKGLYIRDRKIVLP